MKTKSPKSPKMTVSKLAAVLGVSRQLIAAHRKKPDAPALDDVAGWNVFFAAHGRMGSSNVPPELRKAIAQERLAILTETKIKLARENESEAGKLMLVEDAVRHANAAGSFFMEAIERLTREGPPAWAGCTAAAIATHLDGLVERIRRELKEKMATIGE